LEKKSFQRRKGDLLFERILFARLLLEGRENVRGEVLSEPERAEDFLRKSAGKKTKTSRTRDGKGRSSAAIPFERKTAEKLSLLHPPQLIQ